MFMKEIDGNEEEEEEKEKEETVILPFSLSWVAALGLTCSKRWARSAP